MKIPIFEILALIFVLWPLIQRFLDKNKKSAGTQETDIEDAESYPDRAPDPEKQEWERAMRELESIFTGEPVREPVKQSSQNSQEMSVVVAKEAPKQVHSFHEERIQKEKIREEFVQRTPNVLSSDAIYKSLDEQVEVEDTSQTSHSIFADVQNPQKIREFYVMKEVLDKPRSKRPVRSRLLTS
jgi:hypothetical protein